ncbi:MAG: helix-turn-helix domain-containing protein [Deltaproteobacteria bacterium]|nr:MAG: helix-turn-helix domain-containing protein [Deltaproteobacteria bacterium]
MRSRAPAAMRSRPHDIAPKLSGNWTRGSRASHGREAQPGRTGCDRTRRRRQVLVHHRAAVRSRAARPAAMSAVANSPLLTVPEVAARLRISRRSAYRVAREMMHAEIAGRIVIPEIVLERYIAGKMQEPTWGSSTDAGRPGTPTTSIVRASAGASRRARATSRSHAPGSETSSWLRPIAPRTKPKPSTPR